MNKEVNQENEERSLAERDAANIRLAIILGLVAIGIYVGYIVGSM